MAWSENDIRQMLARNFSPKNAPTLLAVVKSVNKQECTVTLEDDGSEYYDVRLRAVTGANSGIVMYPKTGAYALAVKIEDSEEWSILTATEYESIEISIEKLIINGGGLGAMVKIKELEDNLKSLKNYCEALKSAIYAGINAVGISSQANGTTGATAFDSAMAGKIITLKDMADDKIKH